MNGKSHKSLEAITEKKDESGYSSGTVAEELVSTSSSQLAFPCSTGLS